MSNRVNVNRGESRGAASVEAVVVLPVFVILFVGMYFVRDLTRSKLEADKEARRCAWAYSMKNCAEVPPGCTGVLSAPSTGAPRFDLGAELSKHEDDLGTGDTCAIIQGIVQDIVLSAATEAFTKKFDAKKSLERERPNLFGGGTSQVMGKYRLACNLKPKNQDDIISDAWHKVIP